MAISTGAGLALAGGAGLLGSVIGGKKSGKTSAQSSQQVTPMERPDEYQTLWDEFMSQYIGEPEIPAVPAEQVFDDEAYLAKYPDVAELLRTGKAKDYRFSTPEEHYEMYGVNEEGREPFYKEVTGTAKEAIPATGYKSDLDTAYDEQGIANQAYLDQLGGIRDPYLESVEGAAGTHRGLLDEIVNKRMSGDAVGPYGSDIDNLLAADPRFDKLLGERTNISFGGGNPMGFITGPQQRLLSSLLANQSTNLSTLTGAQETGLENIRGTSRERMATDILPGKTRYDLDREIADKTLSSFTPSNMGNIAYIKDLLGMVEPMETARYHAAPNVAGSATGTPSTQQNMSGWVGNINQMLDMASGLKKLFPGKETQDSEIGIGDVPSNLIWA